LCKFPKPRYIQKSNFIQKIIFLTFGPTGPAASRPIRTFSPAAALFYPFQPAVPPAPLPTGPRPLGRPSSPHGPAGHLLPPPAPEPNAQGAAAGRPRVTPTVDRDTLHRKKKTAASIPLHSPINRRHFPSSNTGNRCLHTGAIEAPSTPTLEGARPPPPCLCPIKGCPSLGEDSHTCNAPSLSPQRALALPSRSSAASETPLHRLPCRGNPVIELACPSLPSPAPRSELSGTGAAGGRAPVSSLSQQWPPIHGGPGRRGPRTRALGPRVFL
jgi:hypothetical protein